MDHFAFARDEDKRDALNPVIARSEVAPPVIVSEAWQSSFKVTNLRSLRIRSWWRQTGCLKPCHSEEQNKIAIFMKDY